MYKRIWVKLLLIPLILLFATALEVDAGRVRVKGYYRKDGTYVKPHYRTRPDSNPYNNYSFPGNYNPNTGKITPGDSQKYLDRYSNRSSTYNSSSTYKSPAYKSPIITPPQIPMIKRPSYTYKLPTRTYNRSTTYHESVIYERARQVLNGAVLIAADAKKTYLGKLGGRYDRDSIFNQYSSYGSDYSSKSIFNDYGIYGSNYSSYSPFSKYAHSPPYIVKNGYIIGRLSVRNTFKTTNTIVISPYMLMAIYGKDNR